MSDRHDLDEFARALRSRRRDLGVTQGELADLAGCSERFVHMLEQGKETVRLDKVLDVLGVLGLGLSLELGHGEVRVVLPEPSR